jgi:2-keto-4-pentenoate hydratase/2-oxohepta-3-ene-1,7-dioic acid hydratase in catechol pathway
MNLGTYLIDGALRCGIISTAEFTVTDIDSLLTGVKQIGPLDDVLDDPAIWGQLCALTQSEIANGTTRPLESVSLRSPVVRPSKIIVAGANSWSHLHEAGVFTLGAAPKRPMVLCKPPSALAGPYDHIEYPPQTTQLDYEVELAVVINQRAKNVSITGVADIIGGYTIANDLSARDVQLSVWEENSFFRTHFLGKAIDGFCPLGPWMITPDSLPANVGLRSFVNGELRQNGNLDDLVFGVAELISYCSTFMTLEPGDVFLMGTPAGVGYFMDPPGFLEPGDVVTCEIDGIGSITNKINERRATS